MSLDNNSAVPLPLFQKSAPEKINNSQLRRNLGKVTQAIRAKRASVVSEKDDWEALRDAGFEIKTKVLRNLDKYLLELEASVERVGGTVHWADSAEDANRIIVDLVKKHDTREVIKVKSMTTEETKLNDALAREGISAIETDLAELIIQLANEESSHILVPAIHKNRSEIRELFIRELNEPDLTDDPPELAAAARRYLRQKFLRLVWLSLRVMGVCA